MLEDMERRGVLPHRALLPWRPAEREEFPTENSGETVVFTSFFERGFSLPTGSFFRGLLRYYGLELTHMTPNSIGAIAFFIKFCESYLGIPPHFGLFHYLYAVRSHPSKEKPKVVGGASFQMRQHRHTQYFKVEMDGTNKNWAENWFYIDNPVPALPERTGRAPVHRPEWDNCLAQTRWGRLQPCST